MNTWKRYLKTLPPSQRRQVIEWNANRPVAVRKIMQQIPPGTSAEIDGKESWVVGYAEMTNDDPWLWFSDINPFVDYDKAISVKFLICPKHFVVNE